MLKSVKYLFTFCLSLILLFSCKNSITKLIEQNYIFENAEEFIYSTAEGDVAIDAIILDDESILIGGYTQGVTAATDGTNSIPMFLELASNLVLNDTFKLDNLGYGLVTNIVKINNNIYTSIGTQTHDLYQLNIDNNIISPIQSLPFYPYSLNVETTPDENLVINGYPFHNDSSDVVKYSKDGNIIWKYHMYGIQDVRDITVSPNGAIFAVGVTSIGVLKICKLNSDGNVNWSKTVKNSEIIEDSSGLYQDYQINNSSILASDDRLYILVTKYSEDYQTKSPYLQIWNYDGSKISEIHYDFQSNYSFKGKLLGIVNNNLFMSWDPQYQEFNGGPTTIIYSDLNGNIIEEGLFGDSDHSSILSGMLFNNDKIIFYGAIGPSQLNLYGGTNYDILIHSYDFN